jgi:hypothetical protein
MGRQLDELTPRFRPLAIELLARAAEAGIPLMIAATGRTAEEQAEAVRTGHSKVEHSRHQDGEAIDVVPYEQFNLHGADKLRWDGADPVWKTLGRIGQDLGLRWGGTFKPLNSVGIGWDPGHFEYPNETVST